MAFDTPSIGSLLWLSDSSQDLYGYKQMARAIIGCVSVYLLWRFWKFSLTPYFYPDEPKELPYWIPVLGHAVGFFRNSYAVLENARIYFGNTREPYRITVAGKSIYVLTNPNDVQELYKNTVSISWLRFVQDLYRWIGFSPQTMENLWKNPTQEQMAVNPVRNSPPNDMVVEYERRQLLPGPNLDRLAAVLLEHITKITSQNYLDMERPFVLERDTDSVQVNLMEWTSHSIIHAMTEIYWGQAIFQAEPDIVPAFMRWEALTWKYVFQLPRFISKDMYASRDQLIGAFAKYFSIAKADRKDTNWFVSTSEAELRDIGLDDRDVGRVHMLQHWAINGNMHKVVFWIFSHLLHDQSLLDVIRQETAPGIANENLDVAFLTGQCPRLDSVYHEVLRLRMATSLMRYVTAPTRIGTKILHAGHNVMVPYRELHYNEEIWGVKSSEFNSERFLKDKSLARNPSYRPFGGGQHLCPGRFLAKQSVFAFVALVLHRFDLALVKDKGCGDEFPRPDETKPGLGSLPPLKGDDVVVRLSPREIDNGASHGKKMYCTQRALLS